MSNYALSTGVQRNITSYIGHNTTLPCLAPSNINISALEWTRRNNQAQYVFLSRDGHVDPVNQIPSYKGRVRLKDRELKGGDLSLDLQNIEPSDGGMYECRYKESGPRHRRRGVLLDDPVSVVNLTVDRVQNIKARPGHDIILPCRAPRDATVDAIEWTRSDLESEGYVFLLRDGIPDTTNQHPSFRTRVELSDSELRDGNLSLMLKNVNSRDAGRYECRLKISGERHFKRAAIEEQPVSIIVLSVIDSEPTDEETEDEDNTDENKSDEKILFSGATHEHYGLIGCCVGFGLVYAAWGFLICFKIF